MYRFSRAIYRQIAPAVIEDQGSHLAERRQAVLEACEKTMRRLAYDRHYFAHPTKTLFSEVRNYVPITEQARVYQVINRNVSLAVEHLERLPGGGAELGIAAHCAAFTRKGTPCRRQPLPGSQYCPSHKHLDIPPEVPETQLDSGQREPALV